MKTTLLMIISMTLVLNLSCSGGNNIVTSPILPHGAVNTDKEVNPNQPADITQSVNSNRGVWGAWKLKVDPTTLSAELTPANNSVDRSAMKIGDFYDADLSQFLTVSPCADCLQISGLKISNTGMIGTFDMDITMKHPFGNLAKRPDLHGFDVRLIFASDFMRLTFTDIDVMKPDGTIEDADLAYYFLLLNADGYTSHFDELMSDQRYFPGGVDVPGNLNPYIRFFDDFSDSDFDPNAPSGHNVMPVGSANCTRTARIGLLETTPIEFYIIADVSYGQSAVLANRLNPQYYLPAFHRTEPWRVEYWIENNTLAYNNPLSTADIIVQVFDWQQGATVDPDYPSPANLAGIPEASNVKQVELSVTTLQSAPVIVTDPDSGSGSPSDPLQYRLTIKNDNLNTSGFAYGLIAVRDDLYGKTAPLGRLPIPQSPSGFPYATLDIRDYTCYISVFINIPIIAHPDPYNSELIVSGKTQYDSGSGTSISATHIMDIGRMKFQYLWDYDYDGITFDVDGEGMPSPVINFPAPGAYDVGLKVLSNTVPPHEYIYTIPVYKAGKQFDIPIPAASPINDTSSRGSQSIVRASDRTFIAYVSNESSGSTNREIFLESIRDDGTLQSKRMSVGHLVDKDNYEPSLAIMGDAGNETLFVAYTAREEITDEVDIYISRTNLEMTSSTLNMCVVNGVDIVEHYPCLIVINDILYIYYNRDTVLSNRIYAIKSEDNGSTWTDNTAVDTTSVSERRPTAVYNDYISRVHLFWEDGRDLSTNGWDIYLATSNYEDGVDFNAIRNVSSFPGEVHETSLTAVSNTNEVVLSYLVTEDGATVNSAWLKMLNVYDYWQDDIEIESAASTIYTKPGVMTYYPGYSAVAMGKYNSVSQDLSLVAYNLIRNGASNFEQTKIIDQPLGNVAAGAREIYPALTFENLAGEDVTRVIMGYKQYNDGILSDPTPFTENFGTVNILDYFMIGPRYYID
jgi:hypothetical protein